MKRPVTFPWRCGRCHRPLKSAASSQERESWFRPGRVLCEHCTRAALDPRPQTEDSP